MDAKAVLLAATAALDAGLRNVATVRAEYARAMNAITGAAPVSLNGNRQLTLNSTLGLERLDQELVRRMRGLGLGSLLGRAQFPGIRSANWAAEFRSKITALVLEEADVASVTFGDVFDVTNFGAVGDWNGVSGTDNLQFFRNAVDALPDVGGTIRIPPGDYWLSGPWVINRSHVWVELMKGATVRTTSATGFWGATITFTGGVADGDSWSAGDLIEDCHIYGGGTVANSAATPSVDNGIAFSWIRGFSCVNVTLRAINRFALTAQEEVSDGLFADNRIDGALFCGISATGAGSGPSVNISNVIIARNRITNTGVGNAETGAFAGYAAILVDSCTDVLVLDNVIDTVYSAAAGRGYGIVASFQAPSTGNTRVRVAGNDITGHVFAGISVISTANVKVHDNMINGGSSHGIFGTTCSNAAFEANTITGCGGAGYFLTGMTGSLIVRGGHVAAPGNEAINIGGGDTLTSLLVDGVSILAVPATFDPVSCGEPPVINQIRVLVTGSAHRNTFANGTALSRVMVIEGHVMSGATGVFSGPCFPGHLFVNGVPWVYRTTANMPAGAAHFNGIIGVEDGGAGDVNLMPFGRAEKRRVDGGAAI